MLASEILSLLPSTDIIRWMWFGMMTYDNISASLYIMCSPFKSDSVNFPISDNVIVLLVISPKKCALLSVQMVIKKHPEL